MVSIPTGRAEAGSAERHAFVVAGMHRSGTSAMTRTLSLLGASLPKRLMQPHASNPAGFWESESVADLNDEILQALDSEWDDVFSFRSREYLSNFDRFYAGRAVALLTEEFNGSEVIALKDPRISVLSTFWDRALREAGYKTHYVVMVRNPLEIAESLRSRDGFPREKSFLLWSSYMIAVDRDTRERERTFVSYDQLMSDWRGVRRRIEAKTGLPFPRDTTTAAIEIDRQLDMNLRHHALSADDLFIRADVPEEVKTIYRIFVGACEGKEIDSATLERIEAELSKIDQLVGPLLADLKLSTRTLSKEVLELRNARANADNRSASLTEQLETERSEHGRSLAEIEAQVLTLQSERSHLSSELEAKQRQSDQLVNRIGASEARTAQLAAELEAEREHRAADKLRLDELGLRVANGESKINELVGSLSVAQAERSDLERRLTAHFHETAALSRMVLDSEQMTTVEREKACRIMELYDAVIAEPRWWSILPRAHRSRLQKARLRRLDLFDGEAYLQANPDVAAAGEDPLHHYIHHGIDEQRPTGDVF